MQAGNIAEEPSAELLADTNWLITGVAGFVGSNILEHLLGKGCRVRGLDNLVTGHRSNLDEVARAVGEEAWSRFEFIEGDIRDRDACRAATDGMSVVLHQAALQSVPQSMTDPLTSHDVNCTGFVNMLDASRLAGVRRFVYASSSSTYGDEPSLPKIEHRIGKPVSPYAATKTANELYAAAFSRAYGLECVGLRYFSVFGPRQDPQGEFVALIPRWIFAMIHGEPVVINGDGEGSRDFCFVANVVQANLRAAMLERDVTGEIYNIAVGERTTLNRLFELIRTELAERGVTYTAPPSYKAGRPGDVPHSLADISKANCALGYAPSHTLEEGLRETLPWYIAQS